jgi:hypothetical protein
LLVELGAKCFELVASGIEGEALLVEFFAFAVGFGLEDAEGFPGEKVGLKFGSDVGLATLEFLEGGLGGG